jgi:hypothetical protein
MQRKTGEECLGLMACSIKHWLSKRVQTNTHLLFLSEQQQLLPTTTTTTIAIKKSERKYFYAF